MGGKFRTPAAIAIAAISAGCARLDTSGDTDAAPGRSPAPPIAMRGTVALPLVGSWKYTLGTYSLALDGRYDVHYDYKRAAGPGQPDAHVVGDDKGTWSADANYVYLKSSRGDVIRNAYKLSADGSKMELYGNHVKLPEVLVRQKKQ